MKKAVPIGVEQNPNANGKMPIHPPVILSQCVPTKGTMRHGEMGAHLADHRGQINPVIARIPAYITRIAV